MFDVPAPSRPVALTVEPAPRGLEGVVATDTALGGVRGLEGFYHYRQYSAVDLARSSSFEDVWRLLVDGALPGPEEGAAFRAELRPWRAVPSAVASTLPNIAAATPGSEPLRQLSAALSVLGAAGGFAATTDLDPAGVRRDGMRVAAALPALVASLWRLGRGEEPVGPRPELGVAADYLRQLTGTDPEPEQVRALQRYLVCTIDHGLNASTFTARVVTSTGADVPSAICAAIGALSGPLHGGAPSRALDALDEIAEQGRAESYVRERVERGERIMGFGHRVYKTLDPRAELMKETARQLGGPLIELAEHVESTVVSVLRELKPDRELYANVEFYAGVVMQQCGIPRPLFTPTFAIGRAVGWCAHILEQASDNRLIRPTSRYVGPPPPQPVPA